MKTFVRMSAVAIAAAMILTGANSTTGLTAWSGAQPTARDIQIVQSKIAQAQTYFVKAWNEIFRGLGQQFTAPSVVPYTGSKQSGCGMLGKDNAFYCAADNAVYLDAEFLADTMNKTIRTLGTDGDYAPITIAAHEFGHAVARQLSVVTPGPSFQGEQVADCFAGVITRRAKTDGLLEAGDLAEGLNALAIAGDEVNQSVDMNNVGSQLRLRLRMGNQAHGFIEQRQAAFMHGYYGGVSFCSPRLGIARPPAAIRQVTSNAMTAFSAGTGRVCSWSVQNGGLRVRSTTPGEGCILNVLESSTGLPDHVRVEMTVDRFATNSGSAGIYFGDGRFGGQLAQYGFETNEVGGLAMVNAKNTSQSYGGLLIQTLPWNGDKTNKTGTNRLTLDVHREGADLFFIQYVNGSLVSFAHTRLTGPRRRVADEAGAWVRHSGNEAIFRDFRVSALAE